VELVVEGPSRALSGDRILKKNAVSAPERLALVDEERSTHKYHGTKQWLTHICPQGRVLYCAVSCYKEKKQEQRDCTRNIARTRNLIAHCNTYITIFRVVP
jgi:hypothetical protein